MTDKRNETNAELDCLVTVEDGAHMTCDMIEEGLAQEENEPQES